MNPLILLSGNPPVSGGEPVTNLISNGDFSNGTTGWGWDMNSVTVTGGQAVLVFDAYESMEQDNILTAATTYHFSIDIVVASASDFNIGDAGGTFHTIPGGTSGTVTGTFTPSTAHFIMQAWGGSSGATITIDNIVVWQ